MTNKTIQTKAVSHPSVVLSKVHDFTLTGDGSAAVWREIPWLPLMRVGGGAGYETRAKAAYSGSGLYFMLDCEDQILTCRDRHDFDDLFADDVFELFIWPDPRQSLYFEYELSPLGAELPILVPNRDGRFVGWRPWHYEGSRLTRRSTSVRGGPAQAGASVKGWTAECFIPFDLFCGFAATPPSVGDTWRLNLYRIDYDRGDTSHWAWSTATGTNFHDFQGFGSMVFGD